MPPIVMYRLCRLKLSMEANGIMHTPKFTQIGSKLSITVAEAAHSTGFSENYLRLLMTRRRLPCVRVGRAIRLLVTDLEEFLRAHRHGVEP
jgi:excisionase family DNA binding protein